MNKIEKADQSRAPSSRAELESFLRQVAAHSDGQHDRPGSVSVRIRYHREPSTKLGSSVSFARKDVYRSSCD